MPSYVVACVRWHDQSAAEAYRKITVESMGPYGGRYIARGNPAAVLEGDSPPERLAVLEFPSTEKLKAWYSSPEYASGLKIRHDSATTFWLVIMEGT